MPLSPFSFSFPTRTAEKPWRWKRILIRWNHARVFEVLEIGWTGWFTKVSWYFPNMSSYFSLFFNIIHRSWMFVGTKLAGSQKLDRFWPLLGSVLFESQLGIWVIQELQAPSCPVWSMDLIAKDVLEIMQDLADQRFKNDEAEAFQSVAVWPASATGCWNVGDTDAWRFNIWSSYFSRCFEVSEIPAENSCDSLPFFCAGEIEQSAGRGFSIDIAFGWWCRAS